MRKVLQLEDKESKKKLGVRNNVLCYLRGELPNTGTPIFLYKPLGFRSDRVLM